MRDESIPKNLIDVSLSNGSIEQSELAPAPKPGKPADARRKVDTIIAVIDDATNFAHQRFQSGDLRSRVDYAWVMDGTAPQENASVPFGREWSNEEIELLLAEELDEKRSLAETGNLQIFRQNETMALTKRISHGTHVMDLAAGFDHQNGSTNNKEDGQRIISVQLPRRVILEASGAILHLFLKAAIRYIEARAHRIAEEAGEQLPLIVNFSFWFRCWQSPWVAPD